ncbi:bifunctional 2-polyprenyl-6-hydroxyphenol methylase/3-demethylubiquinol 3-O-methyltransferase UbiG [Thioalkalivibrio sp. ALJT]|uniref:class I SAM-dependent methyltransferase n=1 Tax=Thioalkalivibrio sp. ALJT TaxID=1158146 RepID=UPI00036C27F8|nr:methyltransferase domain-containing protein [Thioalkalivibrio sp. ALJT]
MFRSLIYDTLILRLTTQWYAAVFQRLAPGATVLDIGVGTAGALLAHERWIRERGLHVTGIDIDADYIRRARARVRAAALEGRVEVTLESVYDHAGGPYEAVYFSGSFMLLPEPERALHHCAGLLTNAGRVYFTQTFQTRRSWLVERIKPWLRRLTTIDFGQVTYAADFRAHLTNAGLTIEEWITLDEHHGRAACLVIAKPTPAGTDGDPIPVHRRRPSQGPE